MKIIMEAQLGKRNPEDMDEVAGQGEVVSRITTTQQLLKTYKVVDGLAPVDEYIPHKDNYRVYKGFGKTYSKVLNQSDITLNKNKFYILQLLENTSGSEYWVYMRWGRLGMKGMDSLMAFGRNIGAAMAEFENKFNEKAVEGNYEELTIVFDDEKSPEQQEKEMIESLKSTGLKPRVGELVKDLFSLKTFNSEVKEVGYDASKTPLGKQSASNLKMANMILKQILAQVTTKGADWKQKVEGFCNKFYSFIPHNVGFKDMATMVLDTPEKVEAKMQLIEMISNIKLAQGVIDKESEDKNMLDRYYEDLHCEVVEVEKDSDEFALVEKALITTLKSNGPKIELVDLFSVEREGERDNFNDLPNRTLLWHATRLSNYASILKTGLKLPPADAPSSGYSFGKGIYFYDMASKAATFCAPNGSSGTGVFLLCDVALGNSKVLNRPNANASTLEEGIQSVKGAGRLAPAESKAEECPEGYKVYIGPGVETEQKDSAFEVNEYVVYEPNQVQVKYLLKCRFT